MSNPTPKPRAGAALPAFTISSTDGNTLNLGGKTGGWQLLVVYRGKHCKLPQLIGDQWLI